MTNEVGSGICMSVPVIAIDGPSGSGKGAVSQAIACRLGWHYMDSGAVYRVLGHLARDRQVNLEDIGQLLDLIQCLDIAFTDGEVLLKGIVVEDVIRTEQAGKAASIVAQIPQVREKLLVWQRDQARMPGLVAEGRDMASVVFPNADCKIFLTASVEERAKRRFKQLKDKGFDVTLSALSRTIDERDERDRNRAASPLKAVDDALILDTSDLEVEEVVATILKEADRCRGT